jgi:uncharacterized protein
MSELINNSESRLKDLFEFACRLTDGENRKDIVDRYWQMTRSVTPEETMKVLDHLLQKGYSTAVVKENTGRLLNVFHEPLRLATWKKPEAGHFLFYMMLENREVEKIMAEIKRITKIIFSGKEVTPREYFSSLLELINSLKDYNLHYIKKENILFPYIEKTFPEYRCLQIMWSFHDDYRKSIRTLESLLSGTPDKALLNQEIGKLFFTVLPVIFREEQVVYPVAIKAIPRKVWDEMLVQGMETGWCYGVKPELPVPKVSGEVLGALNDLGTGSLSIQQIVAMMNTLPLDITFVDENDEVRYFSDAGDRIFPRSKAIIGRKVQNCHPPESVHVVNEILETFRNGTRDHADFHINMKGRFIYIRYFALRDPSGKYVGTLEVGQDVTEIRKLEGEKRLLDPDL